MKTINRAYIQVTPTKEFWALIASKIIDKEFIDFHEPSIYLIEEDFWDEEEILKKYMQKIMNYEFKQLIEESAEFNIQIELTDFKRLFNVTFGATVVDSLKVPIESL